MLLKIIYKRLLREMLNAFFQNFIFRDFKYMIYVIHFDQ